MKKWCLDQPVIYIDDSDVVKPDGYKFETLGWVRDGSESTTAKNVYKKGYHVTELCNRRKGKIKLPLFYKVKMRNAYLSHVKVQITVSRKDIYLVLVYGITEHPMRCLQQTGRSDPKTM